MINFSFMIAVCITGIMWVVFLKDFKFDIKRVQDINFTKDITSFDSLTEPKNMCKIGSIPNHG